MINGGRNQIIHRIREQDAVGELPPSAPAEAVAELEAAVGHPMPPLLKRIVGALEWLEHLSRVAHRPASPSSPEPLIP